MRFNHRTTLFAIAFALLGLLIGVATAYAWTTRGAERFSAEATLAMLPPADLQPAEIPGYWEVLNGGQPTRSAAIVLGDGRWLDDAAAAAGVPKSELTLTAGAMPSTTLITTTMEAGSAQAAGEGLASVLTDAVRLAAQTSEPFRLVVVSPPRTQNLGPRTSQMLGGFAIGGLLTGAGVGMLLSNLLQRPRRKRLQRPAVTGNRKHGLSEEHWANHDGTPDAAGESQWVAAGKRTPEGGLLQ